MNFRRPLMAASGWLLLVPALCGLSGCNHDLDGLNEPPRIHPGGFLVRPYLQLGDDPAGIRSGRIRVVWQTEDVDADWTVESNDGSADAWRPAVGLKWRRIAVDGVPPHRVYRADINGLRPDEAFAYRLRRGVEVVFTAEAAGPKRAQPHRVAILGDCGAGTAEQRAVAFQVYRERPDLLLIVGDIVYNRGRITEYRRKFWPVYDADAASTTTGAPLLRSTITVAAPGNHDTAGRDLNEFPDGLAYYLYWDQPLNGPTGPDGGPIVAHLAGTEAHRRAFLDAAGPAYPRTASFSFDYGNAHWTILDSNAYVDWSDPEFHAWVERDLAAAKDASWRFVAFHHPPFNSSHAHFGDQRTRLLVDVFEAGGVDVVWAGHVHNYQRTHPLKFAVDRTPDGKPARVADRIPGHWTLDTEFDGRTHTQPRGIIYVTTGGGGAGLYNLEQDADPGSLQPYTEKFISRVNSFTIAEVDGPTLTVRQVAADGRELDRFVVTKDRRTNHREVSTR